MPGFLPSEAMLAALAGRVASDCTLTWLETVQRSPSGTLVGRAEMHAHGASQDVAVKLFGSAGDPMFGARELKLYELLGGEAVAGVPLSLFGGVVDDPDPGLSGRALVTRWVEGSGQVDSVSSRPPASVGDASPPPPGGLSDLEARRLGSMVASLPLLHHAAPATRARLLDHAAPSGQARGTVRRLRALARLVDELVGSPGAAGLERLVRRCCRAFADPPVQRVTSICHGDFRLANAVFDGDRMIALLDWETWCGGDPRLDLGSLLGGVECRLVSARMEVDPDRVAEVVSHLSPAASGLDEEWEWFVALGAASSLWNRPSLLRRRQRHRQAGTRAALAQEVDRLRSCPIEEVRTAMATARRGASTYGYDYQALGVGDEPADLPDPGPPDSEQRHRFCDRLGAAVRALPMSTPLPTTDAEVEQITLVVEHVARRLRESGRRV